MQKCTGWTLNLKHLCGSRVSTSLQLFVQSSRSLANLSQPQGHLLDIVGEV